MPPSFVIFMATGSPCWVQELPNYPILAGLTYNFWWFIIGLSIFFVEPSPFLPAPEDSLCAPCGLGLWSGEGGVMGDEVARRDGNSRLNGLALEVASWTLWAIFHEDCIFRTTHICYLKGYVSLALLGGRVIGEYTYHMFQKLVSPIKKWYFYSILSPNFPSWQLLPITGASSCSLCSAGRFGATQGLSLCSLCPSGSYSNQQAPGPTR